MTAGTVAVIASHELKAGLRGRWAVTFALVFAALALGLAYFGLVTQQVAGFQGFTRTSASLLNLALYLVPLVGLAMGSLSLTGEKGASEILFAQPVSRSEVLLGKALGSFTCVAAATLFGFGLAGVVIAGQAGGEGVARYLAVAGLALVLALIFIGFGLMLAAFCGNRARAFGAALAAWFFFVLFYDLLVLGAAVLLPEHTANRMILLAVFFNPVEVVRVAALVALAGESIFGAAGAALVKFLGGTTAAFLALAAAALVWAALPLCVAARVLRRRDL